MEREKNKKSKNEKAKHSKSVKKTDNKVLNIILLIIICLLLGLVIFYSLHIVVDKESSNISKFKNEIYSIKDDTTIENEKLVLKSKVEEGKIIEYTFKDNIVEAVKVYEKFKDKEAFDKKQASYKLFDDIVILNKNEEELIIEIERKDLKTDADLTYEQICEKYLIKMAGLYEQI